ncbi:MAG: calcium/sodium antiporter [Gammaproteobacteria bacterium]|nr:calcium/sodium antiporter [Gammaproteobacteria bacterium]
MDLPTLLLLGAGFALLAAGGELLVRGASRLATVFGIAPLVIGLTVVAFGTSAPELAVSLKAGLDGKPDIAVGNVVGSNIFNVLVILGACALILPLTVSRQLVRREVPVMIGVSLLLAGLVLDGRIGFGDGALLVGGLIGYTSWLIVESRRDTAAAGAGPVSISVIAGRALPWSAGATVALTLAGAGYALGWIDTAVAGLLAAGALSFLAGTIFGRSGASRGGDLAHQAGFVIAGLGTLILGASWLVDAATAIARGLGVSDLVIGLTIVAAGTSLPEVATSIVATLRGERDIAIGNVVGSNIFNILLILGLAALVTPGGLPVSAAVLSFDLPIMIAVALACLPVFFSGFAVARWEGALFIASYAAYLTVLVLAATGHPALETFTNAVLLALPLVAATLVWTAVQALRDRR